MFLCTRNQTKVPTWQSNPTTLTAAADLIPKLILTHPPFLRGEDDEAEEGDDDEIGDAN